LPLSWNEIRTRATSFTRDWSDASRERGEAQTFWNEFFDVFGIRRRTVASFEEPVRNLGGAYDFIDLLWAGRLIAEHKSRGRDLGKAHTQALGYIQSLHNEDRGEQAPRYIIVSDFARIALHDLEAEADEPPTIEFPLEQFPHQVRDFAFIAGYETSRLDAEDPANLKATERLANLHDRLEDGGYTDHDLERFMVRVLFCLFAEDTGIFEPAAFTSFVTHRTRPDGSDSGAQLTRLFEVLNTPPERRQQNLDEDLAALPYVNGELFAETLRFPDFNAAMRTALLACCHFRWEKISPAVFGSLFQSIMQPRQRRQIGAHYTTERDIMKLIRSLFLDDLRQRFEPMRRDRRAMTRVLRELGTMRFVDPACGCGNFLVLAYRELRRLELDIIQAMFGDNPSEGDIRATARLHVGQFYGIEIEEWPVRIAEVAMWLMDHQMNAELFERFGQIKATTPLMSSPHIVHANALRIDWSEVLPATQCTYILGNPPFVGARYQNPSQREDMDAVAGGIAHSGVLDYVTGWYFKAVAYSRANPAIRIAFVSTNSITQGEQAGVLWNELLRLGATIHFGHRTFSWTSEARGKAHVHVVIVGWGLSDRNQKRIFDYEDDPEQPTIIKPRTISPYLVEGSVRAILNRQRPLCDVPEIGIGNKPIDDGNYLFTPEQKREFLAEEPGAAKYFRRWLGSVEFINGIERWCLWLGDCPPAELRSMPHCMKRVEAVRRFRAASKSAPTRRIADQPTRFHVENMPTRRYLLVPRVSSERRPCIPMGFIPPRVLASDAALMVPSANLYHFGVLTSAMHMAWVRQVCGRLKSDYRYSAKLVYNNCPWPQEVAEKKKSRVEELAQRILDLRVEFGDGRAGFLPASGSDPVPATLADLYDPNAMPVALRRAHDALDRAVDRCYRRQPFTTERHRLVFLFELYEQLVAPLTTPARSRHSRT
jgi:hypothetical protein